MTTNLAISKDSSLSSIEERLVHDFKVFMLHVGNAIDHPSGKADQYLFRKGLFDQMDHCFLKSDIVNADTQMNSIVAKGVQVEYGHFFARRSLSSLIKAGMKIRSISKRDDIDLIHVLWGTTTAFVAVLFSTKPVVISFSGSDLLGTKTKEGKITLGGRLNRFVSRLSAVFASAVITKSMQMKSLLWPWVSSKTFVIPNGVELEKFFPMTRSEARKEINILHDKPIILFFYTEGVWVKNKELASEVYELVKAVEPDVEMLTLSDIPHNRLIYYYNASNVMILTSFHEGSNNSLKEAKACNLPVVSVDVGDAKERLEGVEHSCVINGWRADLLAQKVIEIIRSGKRSNGSDLSGDVATDFIADRVIDVYEWVVKSQRRYPKF